MSAFLAFAAPRPWSIVGAAGCAAFALAAVALFVRIGADWRAIPDGLLVALVGGAALGNVAGLTRLAWHFTQTSEEK